MSEPSLDSMRLSTRDEFERWLTQEVEVRDELAALMGQDPGLDVDSLGPLERFLLDRWATPADALKLDQRPVLDAAARQVGLVMILAADDAAWDIDLDDPDDVYYRLPVVRLSDGSAECPLSLVSAALDRRTGHYLRDVVSAVTGGD
jgi:hypothetical protein